MAHFYLTTDNSRGRTIGVCANKTIGQNTHQRGWNCGVRVVSTNENGKDVFYIFQTGGSNHVHQDVLLTKIVEGKIKKITKKKREK